MYGAIYGDLVGSIYEYDQTKEIKSINPDKLITESSFFSDDTILTIAILDAILNDRDYDKYLRRYIQEYKDYKPDFNPYFKSSFSPNLIKWAESNKVGDSKGNGAMMRISPVGYMFDTKREIILNAIRATLPSHNTSSAIDSATLIALMIYCFKKGYSKDETYYLLGITPKYTPFTKFNSTCDETLDNCLYAFYNSKSFEDALRKTLFMGGDTDTNCAIVGSIAESYYGIDDDIIEQVNDKIPKEFVKILERSNKR